MQNFNEIRLNIEIEVRIEKRKTTFQRENFTILQEKLSSIRAERTREKMQNYKVNLIEDSNRRKKSGHLQEKIYKIYTKFHPFYK